MYSLASKPYATIKVCPLVYDNSADATVKVFEPVPVP
jgi:hypothetical protein